MCTQRRGRNWDIRPAAHEQSQCLGLGAVARSTADVPPARARRRAAQISAICRCDTSADRMAWRPVERAGPLRAAMEGVAGTPGPRPRDGRPALVELGDQRRQRRGGQSSGAAAPGFRRPPAGPRRRRTVAASTRPGRHPGLPRAGSGAAGHWRCWHGCPDAARSQLKLSGAPGRNRTCCLLLRRQALYPMSYGRGWGRKGGAPPGHDAASYRTGWARPRLRQPARRRAGRPGARPRWAGRPRAAG
jgi:hypothetical protein